MNSQLEQGTKIADLFLKDIVSDEEVANYLVEINKASTELQEVEGLLRNNKPLNTIQKNMLVEVLDNVMRLFRTYGKRSRGLGRYIESLQN